MSLRRLVGDLRCLVTAPVAEAGAGTAGATTSSNVGAFMVPLGGVVVRDSQGGGDIRGGKLLRPPAFDPPLQASGKRRRKRKKR